METSLSLRTPNLLVQHAIEATLAGQPVEARNALAGLPTRKTDLWIPPKLVILTEPPPIGPCQRRKNVPEDQQARLFQRDTFTCRYRGGQALFLPALRLLSLLYPDVFPYDPHGLQEGRVSPARPDATPGHMHYWTHPASADQMRPVVRHGTNDASNLTTACYGCNDWKGERMVEAPAPRPVAGWDGLSGTYETLYEYVIAHSPANDLPYFKK